jgi:flagellar hook-length control protein FliK
VDADVSAVVEQLLALASRPTAPGRGEDKPATPKQEKDTDEEEVAAPQTGEGPDPLPILPSLTLNVAPKVAPGAPADAPPAEAGLAPVEPQQVQPQQAQPQRVQPQQAQAQRAQSQQVQPIADQPAEPQVLPRQIASTRTDAVVQQAFSNLESTVKGLPAQSIAAALPAASKQDGDREPPAPIQDLKLAVFSALAPLAAPVDPARRADPLQPAPAPQVDSAQLSVERHLDVAHEGEWLDRLAKDIAQTAGTDRSPLRFRLNPETLGTLRVEITQERHGAAVRLTTDTETARSIIADAQPRLIAEARAQGIRISEAHVDLGSQPQSGDPRRHDPAFEEPVLRTARSLRDKDEGDGKPTPGRSERYA